VNAPRLPRLHAVTDDRVVARGDVARRAAELAAAGGADIAVHVRSAQLEGRAFLALAEAVRDAVRPRGAWLVVNGRADVAQALAADAVVTGRGGLSTPDVRRVARSAAVGRSVHDADELRAAVAEGADFLIAGSVYETPSHAAVPPRGVAYVRDAATLGRPVIGIGGITPDTARAVMEAGAWGVAAIRAFWDVVDGAKAVGAFLAAIRRTDGQTDRRTDVRVQVNGEERTFPAGISLTEMLAALRLDPRAVVVEHNRRIVRREGLAQTTVGEGDSIELVHFVGGG
jgi:thiamine biosynthesis protein ThiS